MLPPFKFGPSFRMAIKDTVDVCMFIAAVIFSYLDLFTNIDVHGSTGFLTGYIFFLLLRLGYYKIITNN